MTTTLVVPVQLMKTNLQPNPIKRRAQRKSIGVNPALLQGDISIAPAVSPNTSSGSIVVEGTGRRRSARLSGDSLDGDHGVGVGGGGGKKDSKVRLGKRKSHERPPSPVEEEDEGNVDMMDVDEPITSRTTKGKGRSKATGTSKPSTKRARISDSSNVPPPQNDVAESSSEFVFTKQPLEFEDEDEGLMKGKRKGTGSGGRSGRGTAAKRGKAAGPSTQRQNTKRLPARRSSSSSPEEFSQEVTVAETPKIRRNAAFRGDNIKRGRVDALTGKNTGGESRRSSLDLRGKRASSIGSGFDVPPHPAIDDASLYRHLNLTDPPAIKFRALTSWTGMRKRDALASGSGSEVAKRVAGKAIQIHLDRVANKTLDLSWLGKGLQNPTADNLPPNPTDQSNMELRERLIKIYNKIDEESKARNNTVQKYQTFSASLSNITSKSTIPDPVDRKALLEQSLLVDTSLLQPNVLRDIESATSSAERVLDTIGKSKRPRRKSRLAGPEEERTGLEKVVTEQVASFEFEAATFNSLIHRLSQALKVSSESMEETNKKAHTELDAITNRGLPSLGQDIDVKGVGVKKRVDPKALMRAITKEDKSRR